MADAQMDTSGGTLDRSTVGGLFSNGTLSVAAMYQHADDDCLGVAGGLSLGHVDLSGGFVERASGAIGWDINAAFGYLWIDYHSSDSAGAAIVMKYVLGIGNEVDLIFEGVDRESGIRGGAFLRYDF